MLGRVIGGVGFLLLAGGAQAMDLPRYDPEKHCKTVAEFGGTYSADMYNFCIDEEQAAYNGLKARWAEVDGRVQAHCDGVARFGGGGAYEMLRFCVEEEERAMGEKKDFEF